jgi:hypothetical protein
MGDKSDCPICFETVNVKNKMNCYECMTCHQKIHGMCELEWNHNQKKDNRVLRDDILICPVCRGDSIAYCYEPDIDINEDMKREVSNNPNKRGGILGSILRRSKRSRRTRRSKKSRRYRR